MTLASLIAVDPLFNGQMIAEVSARHRTTKTFLQIAQRLTGRPDLAEERESLLSPILRKLQKRRAAG